MGKKVCLIILSAIWLASCSPTSVNENFFEMSAPSVIDLNSTTQDQDFEQVLDTFEKNKNKTLLKIDCPKIIKRNFKKMFVEKVECGAVRVNDSYLKSISIKKDFSLGYLFIQKEKDKHKPLLIISQGGPGGSSMELATFYVLQMPVLLERYNILAVEQRGTRWTRPNILCKTGGVVQNIDLKKCREEHETNVNLSSIHSYEIANDMVNVSKRFGYRTFSFFGVSYGAHLGQVLLNYFPGELEKVVLDSPPVPFLNWKADASKNTDFLMQYFLGHCGNGTDCVEGISHRELFNKVERVSDGLIKKPLTLGYVEVDGRKKIVKIDNEDFVNLLFVIGLAFAEGDKKESLNLISDFIDIVEQRNIEVLTTILTILSANYEKDHTELMYNSITCREFPMRPYQVNPNNYPTFRKLLAYNDGNRIVNYVEKTFVSTSQCGLFEDLKKHPYTLKSIVATDSPVLVVGAEYDYVTLPKYVGMVSEKMPNSFPYVFSGITHGVWGKSTCINKSILHYLFSEGPQFKSYCKE